MGTLRSEGRTSRNPASWEANHHGPGHDEMGDSGDVVAHENAVDHHAAKDYGPGEEYAAEHNVGVATGRLAPVTDDDHHHGQQGCDHLGIARAFTKAPQHRLHA